MPTFQNIIDSISSPHDCFRWRQILIREIESLTGRRLLVYVADPKKVPESMLRNDDKAGFSDLIEDINEDTVDFFINSPGGFAEAAEVIVTMLRSKFKNIRFAVPNMAKSAATLLVLSGNELLMDFRSELGPVDPQIDYPSGRGRRQEAAEDIIDGFEEAKDALAREGPAATPAYIPLLEKYSIGLLRGCRNAVQLSRELAETWLRKYMFAEDSRSPKPSEIADFFAKRANTLSHNRPVLIDKCLELGMKVVDLREEGFHALSKRLWELWCLYELHLERSPVNRMYESSSGCSVQKQSQRVELVRAAPPRPQPPKQT